MGSRDAIGDQPGTPDIDDTVRVLSTTTCDIVFNGSEVDVLQKTDFETDSGSNSSTTAITARSRQPVQGLGAMTLTYIVSNQSDCKGNGCVNGPPDVLLIEATRGRRRAAGGVANQPYVTCR